MARRAREAGLLLRYHCLPYSAALKERARRLRKSMTKTESKLWFGMLRTFQPRFLRQRPIDHFIVDFYCSTAGLVVELDGPVHDTDEARSYDDYRTSVLEGYGLRVIRFNNEQVLEDFASVKSAIVSAMRERKA